MTNRYYVYVCDRRVTYLNPRPAAVTGWGLDVFTYSYHWWVVPILATHTGAIIGAWIYYLAIGKNLSMYHRPTDHFYSEINFPPGENYDHNEIDMTLVKVIFLSSCTQKTEHMCVCQGPGSPRVQPQGGGQATSRDSQPGHSQEVVGAGCRCSLFCQKMNKLESYVIKYNLMCRYLMFQKFHG